MEEKLSALDAEAQTHASDYQKLMEIEEERARLDGQLLELYAQWEELNEE